ncbi:CPBP family intramembrane metalloprotease [Leptospira sp. 2 VSF19]|uniref:CPBP family intramembrane metalloprotease n=1 Tax=Leptospira soteropolitanensis TaxID=2950025 RepID=A0AAW5V9S8_9LEPT|nr:type II CAAX endopeptidase family protein [Leptospira soteropolitanensis]MCW7493013.1 CPBP family intramembrane metalloprotease [Leptospira soteropolitanensis]MCW7500248.1 CPBP family intramembrane metalloprotease [Leptospira soteropolitanensis]MCW7522499.1 CPBP family intramembrane metalloprotease [Leptospira soteropolitanensis]MCW7526355.1 CPBP family intramembrane metalloprotease [Leptospira soteropolitanensis]MCW7529533.1 CPBP family intramembrane metalloprotease [Leptospira soteropolit
MKETIRPIVLYFVLAYLISWMIWLPLYLPKFGIHFLPVLPFHHAWGAIGPLSAAFILNKLEYGDIGVKNLLSRMFQWRVHWFWYFIAIFSPFVLLVFATTLNYFNNGKFSFDGLGRSLEFPNFGIVSFFLYNVIIYGFGEETGWRGYALPKLQKKWNAFSSTVILTFLWALWHAPLFLYRPSFMAMDVSGIFGWFMSLFTGAILLTWLYNSSRGSILMVALFHGTIDIVFTSDSIETNIMNITGFLLVVFALIVLGLTGCKNLSKVDRQTN